MFCFINRTVLDIPINWDRTYFENIRWKYRQSRKLIEFSINVQFEKQLKLLQLANLDIEKNITQVDAHLSRHAEKADVFGNLTEIASQSLSTHFDKRMENIRTIIQNHCNAIQTVLQEENRYWSKIHSAIDQNLITSNDIYPSRQTTSELFIERFLPNENLSTTTTRQEYVSFALPSINKTYGTQHDESTNRSSSSNIYPMYSQPNLPAQLYFSPTFIQDKQSESIRNVLSPIDQNRTILTEPKIIIQRLTESVLLDYFNREESISTSQIHSTIEIESKSPRRKRKQSISDDTDRSSSTITLRKRKSISIIEIEEIKPRKRQKRKPKSNKSIPPIRDLSPLSSIDRSKHYSTRFSTRSDRLKNIENNNDPSKFQSRRRKNKL